MYFRPIFAALSVVTLAACGSKLATSTAGTGASGGAGATGTTGTGGAGVSSAGSAGSTTAQTSSAGGAGGAATTSSTSATGSSTGSAGAGGSCATTPKFKEVLAKPLSGCAGLEPPCHNAGAGGLTITAGSVAATWKQLVNVPATIAGAGDRVVPGSPDESFLYRKLTNENLKPSETPPMPEQGGIILGDAGWQELPPDDIEMVRCWILGGALQN